MGEYGFAYDSSLMGDDRPYAVEGGSIVELPVHWSLDDAPYFASSPALGGLWDAWRRELHLAAAESRPITLTLHPEILGRPHRAELLRDVLALGLPTVTQGALAARGH